MSNVIKAGAAIERREQIIRFQKDSILMGTWQCCLSCDFWGRNEICEKFKARPPALVIATGCPEYIDLIPF